MGILLSLAAAVGYGASDFMAGVGSRRGSAPWVALLAAPCGLLAALVGLWVIPWSAPSASVLAWGAASGLGSGLGVLALYRGLALGQIAVVAPVAGILTALIPAVLGLALGDRPGALALAGIALALPAVALVSWQQQGGGTGRRGVLEGVAAGACFALLFIGLDRAGTASGTWPLVPGQLIALVLIATAVVSTHSGRPTLGRIAPLAVATGGLGGVGNILFLNATGHGELAVVAVITSLYPAITVVLARLFLSERWTGLQMIGLGVATLAVALISL